MCSNILKKCNARVKYLYRKSKFLTPHSRRLLASALVQCHLDYACSFWYSGLTKQFKTQLQNVQNRLIRFVLKLPARTHISADHFISVDWLPVSYRVTQIKLMHVHRIFNETAPDYMQEFFTLNRNVHQHQTRSVSNCNYFIPRVNTFGRSSFYYTSTLIWNSLPIKLKSINVKSQYKTSLKKHLLAEFVKLEDQQFIY